MTCARSDARKKRDDDFVGYIALCKGKSVMMMYRTDGKRVKTLGLYVLQGNMVGSDVDGKFKFAEKKQ